MPLEDLEGQDKFPNSFNSAWPLGSDTPSEGDDHLRGIKNVIRNWAGTFGDGPLSTLLTAAFAPLVHTHLWEDITDQPTAFPPEAHTHVAEDVTDLDTVLSVYAPLEAPELTGDAKVNDELIASQDFVNDVILGEVHKPGRTVSTNYTLVADDLGRTILQSGTNNLTIPPDGTVPFPIGSRINVINTGAGVITLVPGSGVTLSTKDGARGLGEQISAVTLEKTATNTWVGVGDLS
jgi:hypothetical protein